MRKRGHGEEKINKNYKEKKEREILKKAGERSKSERKKCINRGAIGV